MKTSTKTLVIACCLLMACKKEKKDAGCPVTMDGLSGSYKLTALQYKATPDAAPADYLAFMEECEKDDILHLNSDGTYKDEDAGTTCQPSETGDGAWQLHGNTLISDGILNGTVASYDCKTLIYYTENALKPGDRLSFTLEKQ